jgi:hypothetical protein
MPPNGVNRTVVRGKLSTLTGTAIGEGGHHERHTARRSGAGVGWFRGVARNVCSQQCPTTTASATAVPLRDVLGRLHPCVRARRRDGLCEPPEPGCRTRRPCRRRWGRRPGGGGSRRARPRGSGSRGSGAGRTGSSIAPSGRRSVNVGLRMFAQRRVLWLRMAPEAVTGATRQNAAARSGGLWGFQGDMFCAHKRIPTTRFGFIGRLTLEQAGSVGFNTQWDLERTDQSYLRTGK